MEEEITQKHPVVEAIEKLIENEDLDSAENICKAMITSLGRKTVRSPKERKEICNYKELLTNIYINQFPKIGLNKIELVYNDAFTEYLSAGDKSGALNLLVDFAERLTFLRDPENDKYCLYEALDLYEKGITLFSSNTKDEAICSLVEKCFEGQLDVLSNKDEIYAKRFQEFVRYLINIGEPGRAWTAIYDYEESLCYHHEVFVETLEEFLVRCDKGLSNEERSTIFDFMARTYEVLEKYEKAAEYFSLYLLLNNAGDEHHFWLAECFYRAGNYRAARAIFSSFIEDCNENEFVELMTKAKDFLEEINSSDEN
jgi:tetratricopeptide (TPR) repeat protein